MQVRQSAYGEPRRWRKKERKKEKRKDKEMAHTGMLKQ
jgi:hypothetical protein